MHAPSHAANATRHFVGAKRNVWEERRLMILPPESMKIIKGIRQICIRMNNILIDPRIES